MKTKTSEQTIEHLKVKYDENIVEITDTDKKQTVAFHTDVLKIIQSTIRQNNGAAGKSGGGKES